MKPERVWLYVVGGIGFWIVVPLAWGLGMGWWFTTLDQIADLRSWEEFAKQTVGGVGAVIGQVGGEAVGLVIMFGLILSVPISLIVAAILGIRALVRVVKRTTRQARVK